MFVCFLILFLHVYFCLLYVPIFAVVSMIMISRYTPDLILADGYLRYNIANIMLLGSASFVILASKIQVALISSYSA